MENEKIKVAQNMIRYGGGFVQKLGEALMVADSDNTKKIHDTWPTYWDKYLSWVK